MKNIEYLKAVHKQLKNDFQRAVNDATSSQLVLMDCLSDYEGFNNDTYLKYLEKFEDDSRVVAHIARLLRSSEEIIAAALNKEKEEEKNDIHFD